MGLIEAHATTVNLLMREIIEQITQLGVRWLELQLFQSEDQLA